MSARATQAVALGTLPSSAVEASTRSWHSSLRRPASTCGKPTICAVCGAICVQSRHGIGFRGQPSNRSAALCRASAGPEGITPDGVRPGLHRLESDVQPPRALGQGGLAAFDPAVVGGRRRSPLSPETEPGRGGGGGDGGKKSPPGGGGGGDGWWDDFSDWWQDHNPFHTIQLGIRMRTAADPSFFFKLAVECGLDATIILTVNLIARRERFLSEIEFVLSQVAVSLLNDFALVYLLAPTPECSVLKRGSLRARLAELPAHVFQRAPTGVERAYTMGSRVACFGAKAVQYGTVGLVMGTLGSSLVMCLTAVRERLDRNYRPPPTYQPVLGTGVGWLLFMSGSSNVRYNLVNFLEDLAYDRFPGAPAKTASIALRFGNNIVGARAWMATARWLNLNKPRKPKTRDSEPADLVEEISADTPTAH